MFKRMGELLGPLHNESYLHVDEVRGDAYGFGGLTQERRYIASKLEAATQRARRETERSAGLAGCQRGGRPRFLHKRASVHACSTPSSEAGHFQLARENG